jgi:hypothetical protein
MARELFRLSDRERELLLQHSPFYLALASSARQPTTPAQRHFVLVCRGEAEPETDHERAFLNFRKLVSLSRMTVRQVVEYRFAVEVPVGEPPPPSTPPPPSAPAADSAKSFDWGEIDEIDEFGEGMPRPGWFLDEGWRRMRGGYRFDARD